MAASDSVDYRKQMYDLAKRNVEYISTETGRITMPDTDRVNSIPESMRLTADKMPAMERQIGGDHYKTMPLQPWEVISKNEIGFFEGTAIAYIMRWKLKGGVEDLKKAIHTLEYLIESQ